MLLSFLCLWKLQLFIIVSDRLYASGEYSDLVISCRGKEYHVHKAIVCTQSGFLAAACHPGFKVSSNSYACNCSNLTLPV